MLISFYIQGVLTNWTKGFKCSGVEDEDVVDLLKKAIKRHPSNVKIEICAILNDTTGCLMSCAWKEDKCRIGKKEACRIKYITPKN